MTVSELIEVLSVMPQDVQVEVNDNNGGNIFPVQSVDFFWDEYDGESVVIQVNY